MQSLGAVAEIVNDHLLLDHDFAVIVDQILGDFYFQGWVLISVLSLLCGLVLAFLLKDLFWRR